jgi:hypothetical protein
MAAGAVQRLRLKDLDAVLARAKAEGWTELDFYVDPHGPPIWSAYDWRSRTGSFFTNRLGGCLRHSSKSPALNRWTWGPTRSVCDLGAAKQRGSTASHRSILNTTVSVTCEPPS